MKQLFKIVPFLLCAGLLAFVPAVRLFRKENTKQSLAVIKLLLVAIALQGQSLFTEITSIKFDSVTVETDTLCIYRSREVQEYKTYNGVYSLHPVTYVDRLIYAYDRKQKQIVFVRREEAQKELVERERVEKYF